MEKFSWARDSLIAMYRYYESGLDTAGATSEALMFEQWRDELENGQTTVEDSLIHAISVLKENNYDVARDLLALLTHGWDNAMEYLEDAINQACTYEHASGRNIIMSSSISSYDAAIDYLVGEGRLIRLPGHVERWVWKEQSLLYTTPPDTTLLTKDLCMDCFEALPGPHWTGCPRREHVRSTT